MGLNLEGKAFLPVRDTRIAAGPDIPLFGWTEDPSPDFRDPGDWKNVVFGPDGEPVRTLNPPLPGGEVSERQASTL